MFRSFHFIALLSAMMLTACTQVVNNYYIDARDTDSDVAADESTPPVPPPFDTANLTPTGEMADPYTQSGVVYWFDISAEQVQAANTAWWNSGGFGDWSTYSVDDEEGASEAPHADHLFVHTPTGGLYDFGKVEVQVAGQSSGVEWTNTSIPNIHIDADEFQDDLRIGGVEHLRLNNGMVGSMFGEPAALAVHRALGYPAPRTSYGFMGGVPWGSSELLIPMINVEVYKKDFCLEHAEFFGGGCKNIWEWAGSDFTPYDLETIAGSCQSGTCTTKRLEALLELTSTYLGTQEFEEKLRPFVDWGALHRFQCISWLVVIPDDMVHVMNNVVMAEGLDGKFRFLPYSTDISGSMGFGMESIELYGYNSLVAGCQYDEECWADTITTCEGLLDEWEALDLASSVVDTLYNELKETRAPWGDDGGNGMLRQPDEARYSRIRNFYSSRAANAREELELYRAPWVWGEGVGFFPPI